MTWFVEKPKHEETLGASCSVQFHSYKLPTCNSVRGQTKGTTSTVQHRFEELHVKNVQPLSSTRLGKKAIFLSQNLSYRCHILRDNRHSQLSLQIQSNKFFGAHYRLIEAKNFD